MLAAPDSLVIGQHMDAVLLSLPMVPRKPGLGLKFDEAALKRYAA